MNTGLDDLPAIQERNILLSPNQTIDHTVLSGKTNAIIRQVVLNTNNITYLFNITPENQQGSITIDRDGNMSTSHGITLIEQASAVAPARHKPVGPRII